MHSRLSYSSAVPGLTYIDIHVETSQSLTYVKISNRLEIIIIFHSNSVGDK